MSKSGRPTHPHIFSLRWHRAALGCGWEVSGLGDEMRVEEPPKPWVNVFLFSDLILVFSDFVTGSRRNQFNALSLSFSQFLF